MAASWSATGTRTLPRWVTFGMSSLLVFRFGSSDGEAVGNSSEAGDLPIERFGLDVHPANHPGHDPSLGHASDTGDGDHELAVEETNRVAARGFEREPSVAVQALRVTFGPERQGPRTVGRFDMDLLDPGQALVAEQAPSDRVQVPEEFVAEADRGSGRRRVVGQYFGPAQVGQVEAFVEGGIGQEADHLFGASSDVVFGMEAHGERAGPVGRAFAAFIPRVRVPRYSRSLGTAGTARCAGWDMPAARWARSPRARREAPGWRASTSRWPRTLSPCRSGPAGRTPTPAVCRWAPRSSPGCASPPGRRGLRSTAGW